MFLFGDLETTHLGSRLIQAVSELLRWPWRQLKPLAFSVVAIARHSPLAVLPKATPTLQVKERTLSAKIQAVLSNRRQFEAPGCVVTTSASFFFLRVAWTVDDSAVALRVVREAVWEVNCSAG